MSAGLVVRLACGCGVAVTGERGNEAPYCQSHDERRVQGFVSKPPAPTFTGVGCAVQGPLVMTSVPVVTMTSVAPARTRQERTN